MSSNNAQTQRLFFALWPDGALQSQLYRLGGTFYRDCGGKRVRTENLHLTLAFLGSIDAQTRECLKQQAEAIELPAFTLRFDRAGYWRRPRVVWLGAEETPPPLLALVRAINRAVTVCGLEAERRPFSTHLTLLRKARQGPQIAALEPIEWPVAEFAMVASKTLPTGAEYEVVARWPLSMADS